MRINDRTLLRISNDHARLQPPYGFIVDNCLCVLSVLTLTLPLGMLAEAQDIADGYYMVQWNNRATTVRSRSRVQKP